LDASRAQRAYVGWPPIASIGGKPERRTNRRIDCALDETKYPDLRGQWTAIGGSVKYVPDKLRGFGQDAPLTPGYQAIFEANLTWCLSPGTPRVTNGYGEIAFVITPETFHILVFHVLDSRRIFTDGARLSDRCGSIFPRDFHRPLDRHEGRRPLRRLDVETRDTFDRTRTS
jgi:hypothetical protein